MTEKEALYRSLVRTTRLLRAGEEVTTEKHGGVTVTTIDAMPPASDAQPDETIVDCVLVKVGVTNAENARDDLVAWLKTLDQAYLAQGPSYIWFGGEIGDQGLAFQLMALGQVLGLWKVMTPAVLGFTGDVARELAGSGFVVIDGFKKGDI